MLLNDKINIKFKRKKYIIQQIRLSDINGKYIIALKKNQKILSYPQFRIEEQKEYISRIKNSKKRLILGFYYNKKLIYSSGVQLDKKNKKIYIGILNIDQKYLKKGLAKIFLLSAMKHLNNITNIDFFFAGVDKNNFPSIKLFKSLNFKSKLVDNNYLFMLDIKNLKIIKYLKIDNS